MYTLNAGRTINKIIFPLQIFIFPVLPVSVQCVQYINFNKIWVTLHILVMCCAFSRNMHYSISLSVTLTGYVAACLTS